MSLIYRAIWQEDASGLHDRALAAFRWWLGVRHPGERDLSVDVEQSVAGATTAVRFGQGEAGSIQRCSVHVDDGSERLTTTLVTTVADDGRASVWVDQERVCDDAFATFEVHAPELSTRLIAQGHRPRRGPVALTVRPTALRATDIDAFAALLARHDRDLPVVALTRARDTDPKRCLEAGIRTAQVLAGSAAVYLLDEGAEGAFTDLVGPESAVTEGAVRLYLPGFSPDEASPWRHHVLEPERVARDPDAVGSTIVQLLAPAIASRRAPCEYEQLRPLLRHGSSVDGNGSTEAERRDLEARVRDLEGQLGRRESDLLDLVAELEGASHDLNLLQAALAQNESRTRTSNGPADTGGPIPPDADCLSTAASQAQRYLQGIVLPIEACRDLEELDRKIESGAWGRAAWRALRALDAFARDVEFGPGFWQWCDADRSPYGWPASPKKLAMRESESVMSNDRLRRMRLFPVDLKVDPAGRVEMQAHLKIAEGGNHQIPRIYFYDDRKGATGKVHIGYFGPHRHVPNTLT